MGNVKRLYIRFFFLSFQCYSCTMLKWHSLDLVMSKEDCQISSQEEHWLKLKVS